MLADAPVWFPFYYVDYARDCDELSLMQHGAYLQLLCWYYSIARPLPNDLERIYRRTHAFSVEERNAIQHVLGEFFVLDRDANVWRNERADAEIAQWRERIDKKRRAARVRWKQKNNKINETSDADADARADADAQQTHMQSTCKSQSQSQSAKADKDTRARKRAVGLPPDFCISDRVREWAADKGHDRLEERLEHFVGYAKAKGARYVDWDQAFMNAIRDDWAKLQNRPKRAAKRFDDWEPDETIDGEATRVHDDD